MSGVGWRAMSKIVNRVHSIILKKTSDVFIARNSLAASSNVLQSSMYTGECVMNKIGIIKEVSMK